jgi:hypothetical protein
MIFMKREIKVFQNALTLSSIKKKLREKRVLAFFFAALFLNPVLLQANPLYYQGRLFSSSNQPVVADNLRLSVMIKTNPTKVPPAQQGQEGQRDISCVLYEETHSLSTLHSRGFFSIPLTGGQNRHFYSGIGIGPTGDPISSESLKFQNLWAKDSLSSCHEEVSVGVVAGSPTSLGSSSVFFGLSRKVKIGISFSKEGGQEFSPIEWFSEEDLSLVPLAQAAKTLSDPTNGKERQILRWDGSQWKASDETQYSFKKGPGVTITEDKTDVTHLEYTIGLEDDSIVGSKLFSETITTNKLASGAVTKDKLASDAIDDLLQWNKIKDKPSIVQGIQSPEGEIEVSNASGVVNISLPDLFSDNQTFTSQNSVPQITVDLKGRVTSLTSKSIQIGWNQIISDKPTTLSGYGIEKGDLYDTFFSSMDSCKTGEVLSFSYITDSISCKAFSLENKSVELSKLKGTVSDDPRILGLWGGSENDSSDSVRELNLGEALEIVGNGDTGNPFKLQLKSVIDQVLTFSQNITVKEDVLIEKDLTVKKDVLIEENLTVEQNVVVKGQMYGAVVEYTSATGNVTINWNSGNIQTYSLTSGACPEFSHSNLHSGGTYTLIVKSNEGSQCTFSNVVDSGSISYKFSPANANRASNSDTVYTFMRAGNTIYVSWGTGFK